MEIRSNLTFCSSGGILRTTVTQMWQFHFPWFHPHLIRCERYCSLNLALYLSVSHKFCGGLGGGRSSVKWDLHCVCVNLTISSHHSCPLSRWCLKSLLQNVTVYTPGTFCWWVLLHRHSVPCTDLGTGYLGVNKVSNTQIALHSADTASYLKAPWDNEWSNYKLCVYFIFLASWLSLQTRDVYRSLRLMRSISLNIIINQMHWRYMLSNLRNDTV